MAKNADTTANLGSVGRPQQPVEKIEPIPAEEVMPRPSAGEEVGAGGSSSGSGPIH